MITKSVRLTDAEAMAVLGAIQLRREDLDDEGTELLVERKLWAASNAIKRAFGWQEEPE